MKFIANEDCSGGYLCYNGALQFYDCAHAGLVFDESISNCNWPSSAATCKSSCPSSIPIAPTYPPSASPMSAPMCPVGPDNLGPMLSASDYSGYFSTLNEPFNYLDPLGRESQVALLIGGNYDGPLAAEIEGRIVVLGDFNIGHHGVSSIGT